MANVESAASVERRDFDRFLILRAIIAALVVGAGVTIVELTTDGFSVGPLYALLALSMAVSALAFGLDRIRLPRRKIAWGVVMADVTLSAAIMYYGGGVNGQFTTVYCLAIAAGAFLLAMVGGLTAAMLSSICFLGFQVLEAQGLLRPAGGENLSRVVSSGAIDAYMHVSMFFLVGTVGGYLADRIKLKGRALQHAQSALEQLRVDTNYILENMSSGVLVVDTDGCVVTMNAAAEQILELTKGEVVSRDVEEALGMCAPDLASELTLSLASREGKRRQEIATRTRAGRERPLGISISHLHDGDGRRRGIIAVFQDLTEVHEMRERVRKADRLAAIGELSAGIAHELRNPLASISGSIEMLYQELELDGENRRLMELIMRESDRLDRIISDFLEFARLRTPRRSPTRIEKSLSETMLLLKKNTEKSTGITVRLECDDALPTVFMDDEQMRQVFMSLSVNACEAMEDGGTLRVVAVAANDGTVRVEFHDTGRGIEPGGAERFFEPFFTTKEGGTGLGLAIANKIVTAHGGSIRFRNAENRGAVFAIALPVGRPAQSRVDDDLYVATLE